MLENITIDILINIILKEPLKLRNVSKKLYNIIETNNQINKIIIEKYYYNFNLYNIIPCIKICNKYTKYIKNISFFFNNNLSIYEKKILKLVHYIAPKRYYWYDFFNKDNNKDNNIYKYINFFILYYNILEYDKLVEKLNIYVENNNIISIEIPLTSNNIKHYILYKNNNEYIFILKPGNTLDYSLELINSYLKIII